nr:unnamed protein product [Callosobruchus analis]
MSKRSSSFSVFYQNVQCLSHKKLPLFDAFLNGKSYHVLCFNEHWLTKDQLQSVNIQGYSLVSDFCRSCYKHGGTAILVSNKISTHCKSLNLKHMSLEKHFEVSGIIVNNIQVIVVYRSPNGNFQIFCDSLCQIMDSLDIKKGVIFCGDYNVHFGTNDIEACMIEDIFQSYGLRRTVFVETRGKSCLDNIFTNYSNHTISAEVFDTCLSDHKSVSIQYKTDTLPILKTRINYCPITQSGINQLYAAIEACDCTFTNDTQDTDS